MDVWFAPLRATAAAVARCQALISPREHARASRFHFPRDRDRYIVAHGITRMILARYLGGDAAALTINVLPGGKPVVPDAGLSFSIAHAHRLVCCAVSTQGDVGVDIERVQTFDYWPVAQRMLGSDELAELHREAARGRGRQCFFRLWTRKEALVKATGEGLNDPASADNRGASNRWALGEFTLGRRYVGAVASVGALEPIVCRPFPV